MQINNVTIMRVMDL